jgi:preprotein translocase subunit SecG
VYRQGEATVALWSVWWLSHLLNLIIILVGLFLMLVVLIQRGKGGGLAGAFGGVGGSSPFGSRAADQFVKITLWVAGVWVLLIMIHVKVVKYDSRELEERPLVGSTR